jgi:L-fucose mutarotase
MLKGVDSRLNADVLWCLRSMGHGDLLVVADANFPSESVARATVSGRLFRMENLTCPEAVEAILSVMPLDFVDDFAARMEVIDHPDEIPEVQAQVQSVIDGAEGRSRPMRSIERMAFYDVARAAFAVIQTGERRFYGCFTLRMGVIPPSK